MPYEPSTKKEREESELFEGNSSATGDSSNKWAAPTDTQGAGEQAAANTWDTATGTQIQPAQGSEGRLSSIQFGNYEVVFDVKAKKIQSSQVVTSASSSQARPLTLELIPDIEDAPGFETESNASVSGERALSVV